MSANRRLSNSRLPMPSATPNKSSPKKDSYKSAQVSFRKDSSDFESKIPKLAKKQPSFIAKRKTNLIDNKENQVNQLQRSATFNNNSKKAKLPEYQEVPDVKARPFKQKAPFFVKKSNKALTIPMNPRLSTQQRKERLKSDSEQKEPSNLDMLQIPVSLPNNHRHSSKFTSSARKESQGCNVSDNASTNASKSRANSRGHNSSSKPQSVKKSLNFKKVETQNDNFLASFISLREADKKQLKCSRSRQVDIPIQDSWYKEVSNMSFDTDLGDEEYQSIVKNLLPEFVDAAEGFPTAEGTIVELQEISEIRTVYDAIFNGHPENSKIKNETSRPLEDTDDDQDKDNQVCNIDKWRLGGVESMIADIKEELGLSDANITDMFSIEDDEDTDEVKLLGLDKIHEYIHEDIQQTQDKLVQESRRLTKIPKLT